MRYVYGYRCRVGTRKGILGNQEEEGSFDLDLRSRVEWAGGPYRGHMVHGQARSDLCLVSLMQEQTVEKKTFCPMILVYCLCL